jgi:hypothetical protein
VAIYNQRGTVKQYIKERQAVDATVVSFLRRQRSSSSPTSPRLQPWQFRADARDTQNGGTMVAGRPRGIGAYIRGYPDTHRPAAGATRAGRIGRWGQMRQTTTGQPRLDERKAMGWSPAIRATPRLGCERGLRSNFVARRPDESGRSRPTNRESGDCRIKRLGEKWNLEVA